MIFNVQAVALKMNSCAKVLRWVQFCAQNVAKKRLIKCYQHQAFS